MSNIFAINKPINWTSNDVIKKLKKELKLKKIGHGGTLDPLASGILIIGINNGTKLLNNHINENKQYITDITFGYETTTLDKEGEVINNSNTFPTKNEIIKALDFFKNNVYNQVPPIYSAIKINGKPAYKYARENIEIELKGREVKLIDYEIIDYNNNVLQIKINVSKGFYVRSFARDLAHKLNTLATITKLVRTKSGIFTIENSKTIEEFIDEYKQK